MQMHHDLITFSDISNALRYVKKDCYFAVGEEIFQRRRGWAMGASLSEPATLADLGDCIHRLYSDHRYACSLGLAFPSIPASQVVQGVLYVDDSLSFSRALCGKCLFRSLQELFPSDVGFTCEGTALPIPFLQCNIVESSQSLFACHAFSANHDFACGQSPKPKFAKFPSYTSAPANLPLSFLKTRIWERLISFNAMGEGVPERAHQATVDIVCEVFILGWPARDIGLALRSVPRRHASAYLTLVRRYGRLLTRNASELDAMDLGSEGRRAGFSTALSSLLNLLRSEAALVRAC